MSSPSSIGGGNGRSASRIAEITGVGQKTLVIAGTGGAGGVLGIAVLDLVRSQPQMVLTLFREWGPLALIVMIGMLVADRRLGESNQVSREMAASMQKLADATNRIAEKDDERARELELAVGVMARDTSEVLSRVKELKAQMERGAHGDPRS